MVFEVFVLVFYELIMNVELIRILVMLIDHFEYDQHLYLYKVMYIFDQFLIDLQQYEKTKN
jgi:hypothetical protein